MIMKKNILTAVSAVVLLLFSTAIFSQTPNLGLASNYPLFTAVGAFNNTGPSIITGNIGTNVGAFTGFPPGLVTGELHVADATSAQVAIDVTNAYSYLKGLPCGNVLGVGLGNDQTITPGIYCIGAAATLNGELTFDAQDDPDAAFVIQIDGAFATSAFSNVHLINSANLNHIFWQVNGQFDVGQNSVFKGTAIVNGAINLLDGASVFGKALSQAGAINISNNQVNLTDDLDFLPIELLSFTATCKQNDIILKWITASEIRNNYYTIERSHDGDEWDIAAKIKSKANSLIKLNYTFTDIHSINGFSYYRLKQTDFDGNFKYFEVIGIENCRKEFSDIVVYPNPGNGSFSLSYNTDKDIIRSISINNSMGKNIYYSGDFQSTINLTGMGEGIYFLYLNLDSGTIVKKLIINAN
jgi:hypothetical protein